MAWSGTIVVKKARGRKSIIVDFCSSFRLLEHESDDGTSLVATQRDMLEE